MTWPSAAINLIPLHPFSPFLFVFISHCPSLFILHLPPLCLTLSCLRASICLQSFPPSPHPSVPAPSSYISSLPLCFLPSYSFISPSLTRAVTGAVINHQSQALSGTTEPRGAPLPSLPLSLSFICLGLLPLTNLFQLISPPK